MAKPAASGRIVPARKFHADVSMSVVANSEPLFQLCMSWTVPDTDSRNSTAMMDDSGLCPSAASSAAFNTQKAANPGISLATTTFETKPLKLVCKLATHALPIPPPCAGIVTPCAANQDRNWGSVSRITDHSTHLWNLPPLWKFTPPSCRNAISANTIVQMAAGTAMLNSSVSRSTMIWGSVMAWHRFYCTPAVPFAIQNSISRVRPEMTRSPAAVTAQRATPRPCE